MRRAVWTPRGLSLLLTSKQVMTVGMHHVGDQIVYRTSPNVQHWLSFCLALCVWQRKLMRVDKRQSTYKPLF